MIDSILYHVETDKTLWVIPPGVNLLVTCKMLRCTAYLAYWWQRMRTDICQLCRACITCTTRQAGRRVRPPLIPIPVSDPSTELESMWYNFPSQPKEVIMFVDYLTKWGEVFPTLDQFALTCYRCMERAAVRQKEELIGMPSYRAGTCNE